MLFEEETRETKKQILRNRNDRFYIITKIENREQRMERNKD